LVAEQKRPALSHLLSHLGVPFMAESFFEEQSEQSQIKAAIVTDYFWAWAGFMTMQQKKRPQYDQKFAYFDLFAGPGRYESGAKSTPIMILEKAVNDPEIRDRLVTMFNDKDPDNTANLEKVISEIKGISKLKYKPKVYTGEVDEDIVSYFQKTSLVPTFLFVDPFGYKGLSLKLVNSVLKDWGCDCVFFFNYNRINMGLGNEAVEEHMNALFGKERADSLRKKFKLKKAKPHEREAFIVQEMKEALEEMGGDYVLPFRFRNDKGTRTTHHLFFVSKHFRGYAIMRDVMYKHSTKAGTVAKFEYNPADENTPDLWELTRPLGDLEDMLAEDCAGKSYSHIEELFVDHSYGKPYVKKQYKEVLCRMEEQGKVELDPPCPPRRKNTLAEGKVSITFPH
jgi:three-Cys-motif partner protein